MALIVADRVKETSTTTGTGALTLAGAATGFRAFSAVCTTNDTCYYAIQAVDGSGAPTGDWEVGLGTYSGANTLTRTTVLASSNANAAVSLAAGTKQVWLDFSASQAISANQVLTSAVAMTSGTSQDFTIPSYVKSLKIILAGVSLSGNSNILIQVGTGGTPKTSGYVGGVARVGVSVQDATSTAGFLAYPISVAGDSANGIIELTNQTGNVWICTSNVNQNGSALISLGSGIVTLTGILDLVRITTVNGTDTFDAGSSSLLY